MNKRGLLLIVSGPSGAGKGTICKEFLNRNKDVCVSVSATTRQPREGEVDGVNYFFITEDEFKHKIANDDFYEYANNHGNFYGTPRDFVEEKLSSGEDVILEIDFKGAFQVKAFVPDAIYIFILPPSMNELENRIIGRGSESKESFDLRMKNAYEEISYIDRYDYFIVNDELEEAVETMKCIVKAERQRVVKGLDYLKPLLKPLKEI